MKLFYIANIRMPTEKAHGVQIAKMCEALAGQGIEVVLVLPKKHTPIKEDIYSYYKVKQNFKIVRLNSPDLIGCDKFFGRLGFYLEILYFNFKVKKLVKSEKPEILYTREHQLVWLMSKYHHNIYLETHVFSNSNFYKKCFNQANGVIVITYKLKELIQPFHQKVLVAADGVDLKQFNLDLDKTEARGQLKLPTEKKAVIYVGHLYEWKGVETLARAAKYLSNDYQIYFTGGMKNDIIRFKLLAKSENLPIKIIGHCPYEQIPFWLKAADVLVITGNPQADISVHYTSPMKLFEYMAAKRPIVASDLPSFREILSEANSILVKAGDAQAMAEGIKKAGEDSELAKKLAGQAYQDVQQYSWEKRAKAIINFINNSK